MKKIILIMLVLGGVVLGGCLGQKSTSLKSEEITPVPSSVQETLSQNPEVKEAYFFLGGKVMIFKNGKYTKLDKNVTLSNGSILTVKGEVRSAKTLQLKEGQSITIDGVVMEESKYK